MKPLKPLPCALLLAVLMGCGDKGIQTSNPTSAPPNTETGNWQLTFTSTSNPLPFSALSGYVQENISDSSESKFTYMELAIQNAGSCFLGENSVVLIGNTAGTALDVNSLSLDGGTLYVDTTLNSSDSTMSGTYHVSGGCANGAAGKVSGEQIALVSKTYHGTLKNITGLISLELQQNTAGNGAGKFQLSGSAAVTGLSCFTKATVDQANSFVSGTMITVQMDTQDPSGAKVVVQGMLDAASNTIMTSSVKVTSGACAGNYDVSNLTA